MPADESTEQHNQRRAEELTVVDSDKNSPDGLFKGTFPKQRAELWRDEADGVSRCPSCGHEYEEGPECQVCGAELDIDGFSDMSDTDSDRLALDDIELGSDFDAEVELALDAGLDHVDNLHFMADYAHGHYHHHHHHRPPPGYEREDSTPSDGSEASTDSEDEGSLREFVVASDDNEEPIRPAARFRNAARQRPTITISDDDSDEGGAVSNRRPRRRVRRTGSPTPSASSVLTLTYESANGSEIGDLTSAELLHNAGWSPLNHDGYDSENDAPNSHEPARHRYDSTHDAHDSNDESDTETTVGHRFDCGSEERSRDTQSETPTYTGPGRYDNLNPYDGPPFMNPTEVHDDGDFDLSSNMDGDGDTEMSTSPDSRASRGVGQDFQHEYDGSEPGFSREESLSTNGRNYEREPQEFESGLSRDRGASISYYENGGPNCSREIRGGSVPSQGYNYYGDAGDLGIANNIHEVEEESSGAESLPRPPVRRLPRRYHRTTRVQQYDPRISMMFAEHQQSLRGFYDNPIGLDDWEGERRVESSSRNHRRMAAYRHAPSRRVELLRSSRSPSAIRIISSSGRNSHYPRQYIGRA